MPCDIDMRATLARVFLTDCPQESRAQVFTNSSARSHCIQTHSLISTDPPYYDNIGYSDLSDFFYVWLRRSVRGSHPESLEPCRCPRQKNSWLTHIDTAERRARTGSSRTVSAKCSDVPENALTDYPITVYYAFKQKESALGGEHSTGWETLLEGMIESGWAITATWPMRSELGGRI